MKIIQGNVNQAKGRRTVYGWQAGELFCLSPFQALIPRRPFNQYATKEEAEAEAAGRNCTIEWNDVQDD